MEGQGHEELHKFLKQLIDFNNGIMENDSAIKQKSIEELERLMNVYEQYFKYGQ